ncbi:MAG: hypothetical protein V1735_00795 [Nanoarchaeota archaeon]
MKGLWIFMTVFAIALACAGAEMSAGSGGGGNAADLRGTPTPQDDTTASGSGGSAAGAPAAAVTTNSVVGLACSCAFSAEDLDTYKRLVAEAQEAIANGADVQAVQAKLVEFKRARLAECSCGEGAVQRSEQAVVGPTKVDYCNQYRLLLQKQKYYAEATNIPPETLAQAREELRLRVAEYGARCNEGDAIPATTEDQLATKIKLITPVATASGSAGGGGGGGYATATAVVFKPVAPNNAAEVKQYYEAKLAEKVMLTSPSVGESGGAGGSGWGMPAGQEEPTADTEESQAVADDIAFQKEMDKLVSDFVEVKPEIAYADVAPMVTSMEVSSTGITIGETKISAPDKRITAEVRGKEFAIEKKGSVVEIAPDVDTAVSVSAPVELKDDKLFVDDKEVKQMPTVKDNSRVQRIVLETEQGRLLYKIKEKKDYRIIGMIKVQVDAERSVDAQTGEVVTEKKPWWGFVASKSASAVDVAAMG